MTPTIEMLDTVAVLADIPALGLRAGEVGAVVELFNDGEAFEVEFCDNEGVSYAMHTLRPGQVVALHTRGQAWRVRAATA